MDSVPYIDATAGLPGQDHQVYIYNMTKGFECLIIMASQQVGGCLLWKLSVMFTICSRNCTHSRSSIIYFTRCCIIKYSLYDTALLSFSCLFLITYLQVEISWRIHVIPFTFCGGRIAANSWYSVEDWKVNRVLHLIKYDMQILEFLYL